MALKKGWLETTEVVHEMFAKAFVVENFFSSASDNVFAAGVDLLPACGHSETVSTPGSVTYELAAAGEQGLKHCMVDAELHPEYLEHKPRDEPLHTSTRGIRADRDAVMRNSYAASGLPRSGHAAIGIDDCVTSGATMVAMRTPLVDLANNRRAPVPRFLGFVVVAFEQYPSLVNNDHVAPEWIERLRVALCTDARENETPPVLHSAPTILRKRRRCRRRRLCHFIGSHGRRRLRRDERVRGIGLMPL